MQLNVGKEIAAMEQMAVGQLRNRYAEVFGETTNARNKQWMVKKIIWRLQSIAEGVYKVDRLSRSLLDFAQLNSENLVLANEDQCVHCRESYGHDV